MRPPRPDIAAPPFPAGTEWIGQSPISFERILAEGPGLVHFLDFATLNCLRAQPYLAAWRERYEGEGLTVVGVHSPRFPFTQPAEKVAAALPRLGIDWPVALDPGMAIWRDYGCRGWPSLYLWGRGGALRWYHLGEGDYMATEEAIREALAESDALRSWPSPVPPVRPTDAPGAAVVSPTPELYPGGSIDQPLSGPTAEPLTVAYEAGGAYAALDGSGELTVAHDGDPPAGTEVEGPGLVELIAHERHRRGRLELRLGEGLDLYAISFAPGLPAS